MMEISSWIYGILAFVLMALFLFQIGLYQIFWKIIHERETPEWSAFYKNAMYKWYYASNIALYIGFLYTNKDPIEDVELNEVCNRSRFTQPLLLGIAITLELLDEILA